MTRANKRVITTITNSPQSDSPVDPEHFILPQQIHLLSLQGACRGKIQLRGGFQSRRNGFVMDLIGVGHARLSTLPLSADADSIL